jgi:hypothetical protein
MSDFPCPHCGKIIEAKAAEPKPVQTELPMMLALSDQKKLDTQEQISHARGAATVKRFDSVNSPPANDSVNRLTASCEEDLIESVRQIVGQKEFQANGGLWRVYARQCPKALAHAIEDWKLRTPEQQRTIKQRPAWLTDRFKRAEREIANARKSA